MLIKMAYHLFHLQVFIVRGTGWIPVGEKSANALLICIFNEKRHSHFLKAVLCVWYCDIMYKVLKINKWHLKYFKCSISLLFSLQVGPALVFCTFLSAPIIYISARMALVRNVSPYHYENIMTDTRTDCSIVSIVSVVSLMMCRYCSVTQIYLIMICLL